MRRHTADKRPTTFALRGLMLLAAALASAPPASAAVFGQDTRRPLPQSHKVLAEKIGTLALHPANAICTAFCVGADVIATASHCVNGMSAANGPEGPAARELTFTPNAIGSATARVRASGIIAGRQRLTLAPPIAAAGDWALARLDTPVCRAGGLAIAPQPRRTIERAGASGKIYNVALHIDLTRSVLYADGPCRLGTAGAGDRDAASIGRDFANPEKILLHTCDTGGGSSGSPLLIDGAEGPDVVGINVGTYIRSGAIPSSGGNVPVSRDPVANAAIDPADLADALAKLTGK